MSEIKDRTKRAREAWGFSRDAYDHGYLDCLLGMRQSFINFDYHYEYLVGWIDANGDLDANGIIVL